MTDRDWVPSDETLIAFDRGELADEDIDAVTLWLEAHPEAEERLRRLLAFPDHALEALRAGDPAHEFSRYSELSARIVSSLHAPPDRTAILLQDETIPQTIRDYRLLRQLGVGGMGRVYLARHNRLQREAALKLLPLRLAADPWYRGRFEREMAVVGKMDHPNLVRAHDAGIEGDHLFLVMELLDGVDLSKIVARGPLASADACEVIRQAALGLHHAHQHGVVHRDVKPGNLFLGRSGVVKVIDLGLARALSAERAAGKLSSAQTVLGTPDYMAPEQWDTTDVDGRADLYGLGCTLYCLLVGRPPFGTAGQGSWGDLVAAHKLQSPPSLRAQRADVPTALARLVARLLAKQPDQRPASAREVSEALTPFTVGHNLPALLTDREETPRRLPSATGVVPRRRLGRSLLCLAVGAMLVAAVVLWWLKPPGREPPQHATVPLSDTYTNSVGMEFVRVPRGRAWLGEREVEVRADFYLGKYEVTQEQWQKVMGRNPSSFARTGSDRAAVKDVPDDELKQFPVEMVSWTEAQEFLTELNRAEQDSGWTFRLPTVAERDYARRGGPMTDRAAGSFAFYLDQPAKQLRPGQANFRHDQGLGRPCKVGSYPPNRLGLHDLYGNVNEWCAEVGRVQGPFVARVIWGGTYDGSAELQNLGTVGTARSKFRDLGLRVARVPVSSANPRRADFDVWRREVAALPADQQAAAVADLLRIRNVGFHDQVTHQVVSGVVSELRFYGDNAADLKPLQALPGLRVLRCLGSGTGSGELADLGPLRGLPLHYLDCTESLVEDLTPLAGMPLQNLICSWTSVANLTPLKGMKLTVLRCKYTRVSDLEPVKDMPLCELNCEDSQVSDLTPLQGMKHLTVFRCRGARVTDLSPLRGLPLRELTCDFNPQRDTALLRSLKTLERINDKPAAAFWIEVGAKE